MRAKLHLPPPPPPPAPPVVPGMTLRDHFACAALSGLLVAHESDPEFACEIDHYAADAYRIADAMLAARRPRASKKAVAG